MLKTVLALTLVATTSTAALADTTSDTAEKNPATAFGLSLGGTIASVGLVAAGFGMSDRGGGGGMIAAGVLSSLVTPSLGEWYSGQALTAGMGMRAGGVVLAIAGVAEGLSHLCFGGGGSFDNGPSTGNSTCTTSDGPDYLALTMVGAGAALYIAGAVYDIVDAPRAAERYNARHWNVAPTMIQTATGPTAAMGISGTF